MKKFDGTDLREARMRKEWSQARLAEEFEVSQKQVSLWESGAATYPDQVETWVAGVLADTELAKKATVIGLHSEPYSNHKQTFQRLWAESAKRIKHLRLDAVLRPSKVKGFADAEVSVTFEGARIPVNDPLYLDCLGVPPPLVVPEKGKHEYGFDGRKGSHLVWGEPKSLRAKVQEETDAKKFVGPHAIAYKLHTVDDDDVVVVNFTAERGCRTDALDSIGVPVYADCVVEQLSVHVRFVGLRPTTNPKAEVWLLRRTVVKSTPIGLTGALRIHVTGGAEEHGFDRLMYPKAGFGYCLAWGGLEPK